MKVDVLSLIRTRYNTLSSAQKTIADYVLGNPEKVILHSMNELAQICNTSESTVIRFLTKLDFESFQVFRVSIAQEISQDLGQVVYGDVSKDDTIEEIKKKVIEDTGSSLKDLGEILMSSSLELAVNSILEASSVVVIGVGSSGFIAGDMHHKIMRLGIKGEHYTDSHLMSIRCTQGKSSETLIAISHSGESVEIIEAVKIAKDKGIKIIAITSHQNSILTKLSDISLLSSSMETSYRSDAMISRILQLVIVDIICIDLTLKMGDKGIENINQSRLSVAKKK